MIDYISTGRSYSIICSAFPVNKNNKLFILLLCFFYKKKKKNCKNLLSHCQKLKIIQKKTKKKVILEEGMRK